MRDTCRFRAALGGGTDSRFPVLLQVSVDQGQSWHPVTCVSEMTLRESVDEVPTADVKIFVELDRPETYPERNALHH